MAGISDKAIKTPYAENKYRFQKQELQNREFSDGSGLEMYEFKYRFDDPQIGRFWSIDPLANKYEYNSPYAFSEDKVTGHVELEGLEAEWFGWELYRGRERAREQGGEQAVQQFDQGSRTVGKILKTGGIVVVAALQPKIGIPLMMTEITGLPVTPSPQAFEGAAISEISSAEGTDEGGSIPTETNNGVNLTVKGRSDWTPEQNADGLNKATTLTQAETMVNLDAAPRTPGLRNRWIKAGNPISKTQDVDHLVDLQLGGADNLTNAGPLDRSVNRSFGPQIYNQIKKLPNGTVINTVNFIPYSK